MVLGQLAGAGNNSSDINSSTWQQCGIMVLASARRGSTWQQRRRQEQQLRPGRGQRGVSNSGKSRGDAATTAARTMAREMWQHKSDAARTTGYCGDGGGGVDRDGGDKSGSTAATTTGYGGDGGGLQRKFGARLAPTSGNEKSI